MVKSLTRQELAKRLAVCQQRQLCFVSLKPLDGNGAVQRVHNSALGIEVRVLRSYVK